MAHRVRVTTMNGTEFVLTQAEADNLASAKNNGTGVVAIARLGGTKIVPSQVVDFASMWVPDTDGQPAIEAGARREHGHQVGRDGLVMCACGRKVHSYLVVRKLDKKQYAALSGYPGMHYAYEEGGLVCVVSTRFLCGPEQAPDGMRVADDAEYKRFAGQFSWLQRPILAA